MFRCRFQMFPRQLRNCWISMARLPEVRCLPAKLQISVGPWQSWANTGRRGIGKRGKNWVSCIQRYYRRVLPILFFQCFFSVLSIFPKVRPLNQVSRLKDPKKQMNLFHSPSLHCRADRLCRTCWWNLPSCWRS